jgi:hypothetical protein
LLQTPQARLNVSRAAQDAWLVSFDPLDPLDPPPGAELLECDLVKQNSSFD